MVYGINSAKTPSLQRATFSKWGCKFKIGVGPNLLLSYRLIKHILSIEFGPIVQVGGKFKSEYDKENNIISGTLAC
jgi:hypothetical protein